MPSRTSQCFAALSPLASPAVQRCAMPACVACSSRPCPHPLCHAEPRCTAFTHTCLNLPPFTFSAGERIVLAANGRGGLATVALRPSGIFGEHDALLVPTTVEKARQGKMRFMVGSGENLMDWTYAGNVAQVRSGTCAACCLLLGGGGDDCVADGLEVLRGADVGAAKAGFCSLSLMGASERQGQGSAKVGGGGAPRCCRQPPRVGSCLGGAVPGRGGEDGVQG